MLLINDTDLTVLFVSVNQITLGDDLFLVKDAYIF